MLLLNVFALVWVLGIPIMFYIVLKEVAKINGRITVADIILSLLVSSVGGGGVLILVFEKLGNWTLWENKKTS